MDISWRARVSWWRGCNTVITSNHLVSFSKAEKGTKNMGKRPAKAKKKIFVPRELVKEEAAKSYADILTEKRLHFEEIIYRVEEEKGYNPKGESCPLKIYFPLKIRSVEAFMQQQQFKGPASVPFLCQQLNFQNFPNLFLSSSDCVFLLGCLFTPFHKSLLMNVDASMNDAQVCFPRGELRAAALLKGCRGCSARAAAGEFCRGHQRFFFPLSALGKKKLGRSALAASVVLSASDEKSFFTSHHHPLRLSLLLSSDIYTESKCENSLYYSGSILIMY